jgi:hypothetical protein
VDPRADFRPTGWEPFSPEIDRPTHLAVRDLLCPADPSQPSACEPCLRHTSPVDAARCALDRVYGEDEEAGRLAHELLSLTGTIAGVEKQSTMDAAYLGAIPIAPVVPKGSYKHHLGWLRDALSTIETTFNELSQRAPSPMMFRTRPSGIRFYRTREKSYPSAYAENGIVGYNVEGPLHETPDSVLATLFHEVFHLNDEGHGRWSESMLASAYETIVQKCQDDHDCYTPLAPHDTTVPDGTYYAFDARTRDVREYAAEVALRYFLEHRKVTGGSSPEAPFKCAAPENEQTWRLIAEEFFGGLDLIPPCTTTAAQDTM